MFFSLLCFVRNHFSTKIRCSPREFSSSLRAFLRSGICSWVPLSRNGQQKKKLPLRQELLSMELENGAIYFQILSLVPSCGHAQMWILKLDNILLEAITSLKEPGGSDRASIAVCIEEKYATPPNLKKLLATKLKLLVANGTLIKVNHKYRIAPRSTISEARRSPLLPLEGRQKDSSKAEKKSINFLTKTQVDAELSKMRSMTAEEAAAAAAQAVAEAEVAIAEAEKAAREAEAAEAEAEAAKIFAKAAEKALKSRMQDTWFSQRMLVLVV
ncbi:telomere repeat-binding factor 2-like isoform X4 [Durio zibethinus]|uniref:Telomere repeat-binding factor 2-like isoform X4 n=1 Tax=Durio zibethinus TaxID=66656 RepID=A0A6P5YHS1_DURZI|nr:telomere repeat-binding factor 2-like isoform X4 [Durio zibethinus]